MNKKREINVIMCVSDAYIILKEKDDNYMMLSRGTKVYLGEKELKHCFKIDMDIINNEIEIQAYVEDIKDIKVDRYDRITVDIHGKEFYFSVEEARVHIEPEEPIMVHIKGFKLMVL